MENIKSKSSDEKKCILVLGMHRSGTSALTGVLNILGVNLGENLLKNGSDNIKGHFENRDFLEINENILKTFGMEWDSLLYLPEGWEKNKKIQLLKEEIKKNIENTFYRGHIFAIKDPRMLKLFPIWKDVLHSLNFKLKIIFAVRHPMEVALSLQKRDNMSLEKGLLLFVQNILNAEVISREYDRVVVPFDDLMQDTFNSLASIEKQLKIDFPNSIKDKQEEINIFIDANLKHHNIKDKTFGHLKLPFDIYDFFQTLKFKKITKYDMEKVDEYQQLYNEKYGKIIEAMGQDYDNLLQRYNKLSYNHNTLVEDYNKKQRSIRNAMMIILSRTIGRVPILGKGARSIWKTVNSSISF